MRPSSGVRVGPAQHLQSSYSGSPMRRNGMARSQSAGAIRSVGVSNKDWLAAANLQDRSKRMDVLVRRQKQAILGNSFEVKTPARPMSASGIGMKLGSPSTLLHGAPYTEHRRPMTASMRLPAMERSHSVPSSGAAMDLLRDREVLVRQKFNSYGGPRHVGAVHRSDVPAILQDLGVCNSKSPRLDRLITDSLGPNHSRDVSFHEFVKLQNDYQADFVKPIRYEIGVTTKARKPLGKAPPGSEREKEEAEKDVFRNALEAALEQAEEESLKEDFCAALERALLEGDHDDQEKLNEKLMDKARAALSLALGDDSDDDSDNEEDFRDKARRSLEVALLGTEGVQSDDEAQDSNPRTEWLKQQGDIIRQAEEAHRAQSPSYSGNLGSFMKEEAHRAANEESGPPPLPPAATKPRLDADEEEEEEETK